MFRTRLLVACMALWCGMSAWAQDYPVRPVRLVTMFAPGSASDQHARFLSQKLTEQLGQQVLVDNKGGAGGLLATREVLRAQPVGYSLLLANTALVGNLYGFKDPQYKLEDYAPVGILGLTYYCLIIHTSVAAKTLAEFVAYAKTHPGKLNYGSLGPSAGSTINAERFKQMAGIDMLLIPFKGGDPVSVALLAGDIQAYFATVNTARTRMRSPQIRGLAVTAEQRSSVLPDVPTFREQGYPAMQAASWTGVFVPAVAPTAVIQRLRNAYSQAAATQEMKSMLERQEFEPWAGTLEQFMASARAEGAALAVDYKRLNIPVLD